MLKQINKSNLLTTPFSAAKDWHFYSIANDDLVKVEANSEDPLGEETFIALDYIDYYGNPILNRVCNLALEQQDQDQAIYEEGEKRSGYFYPDSEPKNDTGTYKRSVYDQIYRAFYNEYKNPLAIFGVENMDFALSRMRRYFADNFRMFSFSRKIFGDAIRKKSVTYIDNALDDYAEITDDGYGNLVAKHDLFSRIQEVRKFQNEYREGTAEIVCPPPDETTTTTTSTTSTTSTSTTSTSTTSTSTSSTSTSTTSTTTPPPPTTTTTSTSTTSTSTTSTSTTSTSTTTTSTTTPPPPTTTTSTSTSTTSTSTSTTSTSTSTPTTTSTTTQPPCDAIDSCEWASDALIPVVHWKPYEAGTLCGECQCDDSTCSIKAACLAFSTINPITGINTIPGTVDCLEANPDTPPPDCVAGLGQNLPSRYHACWLPVILAYLDEFGNARCGWEFWVTDSAYQPDCQHYVDILKVWVGP